MTEKPDQTVASIAHTLEEIERLRAHALEQMRQLAAQADEMAKDKARLEEIAASMAVKYGLKISVNGKPIEPAEAAAAASEVVAPSLAIQDLIRAYREHADSPYRGLRASSRENYDALIGMIGRQYGTQAVHQINAGTLQEWYTGWKAGNKIAVAHSKMVMLRNLFGFGFSSLGNEDCARLSGILRSMQLELPKARNGQLTREQADLIRAKAYEKNRPSIALAQAFQFDAGFTQKETIGEWVPVAEPGISDTIQDGMKWIRGLRWEGIDQSNLTLAHIAGDKLTSFDLKKLPMVSEEIERFKKRNEGKLPSAGPIIVSEFDGLPWAAVEFRRWWRMLADECKIPKNVKNADSRSQARRGKNATAAGERAAK